MMDGWVKGEGRIEQERVVSVWSRSGLEVVASLDRFAKAGEVEHALQSIDHAVLDLGYLNEWVNIPMPAL